MVLLSRYQQSYCTVRRELIFVMFPVDLSIYIPFNGENEVKELFCYVKSVHGSFSLVVVVIHKHESVSNMPG